MLNHVNMKHISHSDSKLVNVTKEVKSPGVARDKAEASLTHVSLLPYILYKAQEKLKP